jgi:hypothetical protein
MKKFTCYKCSKCFNRKSHLDAHLNKKNSCDDEIIDIDVCDNITKDELEKCIDELRCAFCKKKFVRKSNLTDHMKKSCQVIKHKNIVVDDILNNKNDDKFKQLEDENKKLKQIIEQKENNIEEKLEKMLNEKLEKILNQKTTTKSHKNILKNSHNTLNNNSRNKSYNSHNKNTKINSENINNQNVFLNNYTGNGMPPLTHEQFDPILKRGYQIPVELTRAIHFNPEFPEFHNIYLPKINETNAMVFIDGNWKTTNRDEIIDDIYENKRDFVIQQKDTLSGKLNEYEKKRLNRWLTNDDNKDEAIINTKNDIKKLLFDNRHMVINRKKELEKRNKKNYLVHKIELKKKENSDTDSNTNSDSYDDSSNISNYSYIHSSDKE